MAIRVLIADDHEVVREGLQLFLTEADANIRVVGHAADGMEALELMEAVRPDIALIDYAMPRLDGIDVARRARSLGLPVQIVILTTFIDERRVREAVEAGAMGYLLKDMGRTELLAAIHTVALGRPAFHPHAQEFLIRQIRRPDSPLDSLTDREREVLRLIAHGESNKAIARTLALTVGTVKGYVSAIFEKLGVSSRTQAALLAVQHGLGETTRPTGPSQPTKRPRH